VNAGPTSERVYEALKRRILERGWRPGDRLDPSSIGEQLNSSVTPVRDALNILSGERLVDTRTSEGFHVPPLDAPALEDLYIWNAQVLDTAIRSWRPGGTLRRPTPSGEPAEQTAILFAAIAGRSDNVEHARCIASLNDRLHAVRLTEPELIASTEQELAALSGASFADDARALRAALATYHRTRRRHAPGTVRALYRPR
jgi:DNA-binding transcriptional MocR family regulator